MSGDCARTSQSAVDRRNWIGCRSEGMMGDSAANSLNKGCVGMSPGMLHSPVTRTYSAGSIYLFKKKKKNLHKEILRDKVCMYFQLPGRADCRGVGLTVFLGAFWVTALWV